MPHAEIGIGIAAGAAITAALFLYFAKIRKLPPRVALQRAIALGFEIWQAADYVMPGSLADPQVRNKALREAGLVLKGEILGQSVISGLSADAARPHPELIGVDPLALAQGVAGRILESPTERVFREGFDDIRI